MNDHGCRDARWELEKRGEMDGQQEAPAAPGSVAFSEVPSLPCPPSSLLHSQHYQPNASEGQEILGVRLLKLLASPFASLTRSSQTLLRLDFRRPLSYSRRPSGPSPPPPSSSSPFGSLHGSRTRLQLMQVGPSSPSSFVLLLVTFLLFGVVCKEKLPERYDIEPIICKFGVFDLCVLSMNLVLLHEWLKLSGCLSICLWCFTCWELVGAVFWNLFCFFDERLPGIS